MASTRALQLVVCGWSSGTLTYLGITLFFVVQFQTYYIQRYHIIKTVVTLFTYKHLYSVYGTYHYYILQTQKDSPLTSNHNWQLHKVLLQNVIQHDRRGNIQYQSSTFQFLNYNPNNCQNWGGEWVIPGKLTCLTFHFKYLRVEKQVKTRISVNTLKNYKSQSTNPKFHQLEHKSKQQNILGPYCLF